MSARDERTGGDRERAPREPRVVCTECRFAWYSARMAEGLEALGSCPRCAGELRFVDATSPPPDDLGPQRFTAPHLALGIPRPSER